MLKRTVFWIVLLMAAGAPAFGQESLFRTEGKFAQFANGSAPDIRFWTKISISPQMPMGDISEDLRKVKIKFIDDNGKALTLATNIGQWSADEEGKPMLVVALPSSGEQIEVISAGEGPLVSGWVNCLAEVKVNFELLYNFQYAGFFGQVAVPSAVAWHSFQINAELNRNLGIVTGIALANLWPDKNLKITARLRKGPTSEILAESVFNLGANEHRARFIDEEPLFPGFFAGLNEFNGVVQFVVSDSGSNQSDTKNSLVATAVRFVSSGNGRHNLSASKVYSQPFLNKEEFKNSVAALIRVRYKDEAGDGFSNDIFNFYFDRLMKYSGILLAEEMERGGFGKFTFKYDPGMQVYITQKNFSEYPQDSWERTVAVRKEVIENLIGAKLAVLAIPKSVPSGGGNMLTMDSKHIEAMKDIQEVLSKEKFFIDDQKIFLGSWGISAAVHEWGHVFGLSHDKSIDESVFKNRFTHYMFTGRGLDDAVSVLYILFPQIKWKRSSEFGPIIDDRYFTFSKGEMETIFFKNVNKLEVAGLYTDPYEICVFDEVLTRFTIRRTREY